MSTLRVATWNAEGMFVDGTKTRRAGSHEALRALRKLNADVVFVPEFGYLSKLKDSVVTTIKSLGYELVLIPYNDPRIPDLGLAIMTRLPITKKVIHNLPVTGRAMVELFCANEADKLIRVVGVHLDDREEAIRLEQVALVTEVINAYKGSTILMGDFNAMHKSTAFARVTRTRTAAAVATYIPHEQISSVAKRVHEMASGTTIDYLLRHTTLRNLDPSMAPTISAKQRGMEWAPSVRLAKIDWIFASADIQAVSHHVKKDVGSDHRQVVADVKL
jgi:endonuclease/exonuclease/phosphatase family metal-dependent hydrolase